MDNSFSVKDFGIRLRVLRKERGYSQEGFAHAVDLDRTYIGGIERGERNPGLKAVLKIAETLALPPTELFTRDDQ